MSETINPPFEIDFLDHVAIRVSDMEVSVRWYERVLDLKKYQFDAWGTYPIFMMAGKTGIAIFPTDVNETDSNFRKNSGVKIDHFAFNVTKIAFEAAKKHFVALGLKYSTEDHHYFQSIYTNDPDGHTVELTTLVVPESEFYIR
tara:strand:+ start:607 stop:1038 length:432 start_codon:yes stop_codon:yes gene_type:complete